MKIALIAMSGIRVCDQELLHLGLTLPGFVERSKVIASLPSLGLLTLAGMTPKPHEVSYFEVQDLKTAPDLPLDFDLVAISSYSAQIDEAYELAGRYRTHGVATVMGGLHVTALPREAARHCDAVVIGEGELSWPALLKDAEKGKLRRFYGPQKRQFDFAAAPMPAFELLDISKYNRLTVQTSRGCPHRCEFCASSVMFTRHYAQKPQDKVLAEINKIQELWHRPFLEFADDNTLVDRAYWKSLLRRLCNRNLRWFTETDISVADDDELLELMYASGCVEVLIGLESPLSAGLDGVELNTNWKLKRLDRYREAIRRIQANGIRVNGCFILGLDGQRPEIFDEVARFVRETELFDVQITIQTPFPGTPLYHRLKSENRLLEPTAWHKCTLFDLNFEPRGMTADQLVNGFRDLGVKLYCTEFTAWRRRRFWEDLRALKGKPCPA